MNNNNRYVDLIVLAERRTSPRLVMKATRKSFRLVTKFAAEIRFPVPVIRKNSRPQAINNTAACQSRSQLGDPQDHLHIEECQRFGMTLISGCHPR